MNLDTNESKPGYKTTEFWLAMISNVAILLNLVGAWTFVPDKYAVIAGAVINGAYAISRGQAKSGIAYTPPVKK